MTLNEIQKKMRHANRKNYVLYLFCNFMGLLMITAYSAVMLSPTVMEILPQGGDSRKQMFAVFALACVGCVVFTVYAANLFFRKKSKEIGIFMALGASRNRLIPVIIHETMLLSGVSALAGIVIGIPFAWCVWRLFRLFIVDSPEMILRFDYRCLLIPLAFFLLVVIAAAWVGLIHLRNTNIMNVICEEHKNEPIKELKKWCGPVGIIILLVSAVLGYYSAQIYMNLFHAYPPAWVNLTYLPIFIGLYMILLHTIVHGWKRKKKHPYKGLIARSMMKFQGRQTVNSMLVVTVLIAGACFGLFYIPILGVGMVNSVADRQFDYGYRYPGDVAAPDQADIENWAEEYDISLKDWTVGRYAMLAFGSETQVEDEGNKFHYEYRKLASSGLFFSESAFAELTGTQANVKQGTYKAVLNSEESNTMYTIFDGQELTNMSTRVSLPVTYDGNVHNEVLIEKDYYVLNDEDYQTITLAMDEKWTGTLIWFNTVGEDSYAFATRLYDAYVEAMAVNKENLGLIDPIETISREERGLKPLGTEDGLPDLTSDLQNSTIFRMYWDYFPSFRILDQMDSFKQFAVFFMIFLFVAIICLMTALVICYTRCMTIGINNRYVFDDLKHLGASPEYLKKEIHRQSSGVFLVPSVVGMSMMCLLYGMILYANDGKITSNEISGFLFCLVLIGVVAALIYGIYRMTVRKMYRQLL